jgi:hypothetical protein
MQRLVGPPRTADLSRLVVYRSFFSDCAVLHCSTIQLLLFSKCCVCMPPTALGCCTDAADLLISQLAAPLVFSVTVNDPAQGPE